jgi:hypothetical protein
MKSVVLYKKNLMGLALALILVVMFVGVSFAEVYEDKFIKIWAQKVTYNKYRKVVEAVGKVSVKTDEFRIDSPYVKYFPDTKKLVADDKFTMQINAYKIYGSRLEYNIASKTGSVMIVRINFGETFLGGSFMKINNGKFDILNAYFTGCNLSASDYHVSSTEIVFYPRTGLLVAYWGIFWIGPVPTLPIPTFVYTAPIPKIGGPAKKSSKPKKKYIERKRDVFPRSGLGSNQEDGYFLVQPFDYYSGPRSYMRSHLSWAEKKNFGIATAFNYFLWGEIHEGEIRAGVNAEDGTFGGLTYIYSFGPRLLDDYEDNKYVYDKYFIGNKYFFEFEINGSYRERINLYKNTGPFSRVSFLPKATLRANRNNFINEHLTYFSEVSFAEVSEESSSLVSDEVYIVSGQRTNFKGDVTFDYDLWLLGRFTAKSDFSLLDYGDMGQWNTATQNLGLSQDWGGILETGIGHRHIYMNDGSTPYEFEGYWFSPFDTLSTYGKLNLFFSHLIYDAQYDLPSQNWRKIEYGLSLGMHCYNIVSSYVLFKDPTTGEELTEFNITAELAISRW